MAWHDNMAEKYLHEIGTLVGDHEDQWGAVDKIIKERDLFKTQRDNVSSRETIYLEMLNRAIETFQKIYGGLPSYGCVDGSGVDARLEVDKILKTLKE